VFLPLFAPPDLEALEAAANALLYGRGRVYGVWGFARGVGFVFGRVAAGWAQRHCEMRFRLRDVLWLWLWLWLGLVGVVWYGGTSGSV
jgi:hypothetical protein